MTKITVKRNIKQQPVSVEVRGHTLFAPHGQDIVCAAVSVLVQSILLAIKELLGVQHQVVLEEGYMFLTAPSKLEQKKEEKYYLLVETMLLGLKAIAGTYPDYLLYVEKQLSRKRRFIKCSK
ncbi:MAG: ribosomal-processing cysteine protease Prp [Dethiobacteria bacterium]|jgi:uncharacterized protein YsxB (DUF464 family)